VFLPDLIVRSRRVITAGGVRAAALHIRHEKIIGILGFDDVPAGCSIDDAGDLAIMPGLVDTHAHAGEGYVEAGGAAAAGGVTTIVDMPCPDRPTATVEMLEQRHEMAIGSCVDVGFWGSASQNNAAGLAPLYKAGVLGFACLEAPEADLTAAMQGLASSRAPLLVHPARKEGRWSGRLRALLQRPMAEPRPIAQVIELCRLHQVRTHLVQLSSSEALTPLYHARAAGLPISAETSARYLFLTPDQRARADREFLWAALANGLIQMVVSDHGGEGSTPLQLSLPAVWTEAAPRGFTVTQIAEWMCRQPSQLAGLAKKGVIDIGADADLVLFDPDREFIVEPALLGAGHRRTPYLGHRLRGVVERTYLRGIPIYSRESGLSAPRGRVLRRGAS
jgi:allantoinase